MCTTKSTLRTICHFSEHFDNISSFKGELVWLFTVVVIYGLDLGAVWGRSKSLVTWHACCGHMTRMVTWLCICSHTIYTCSHMTCTCGHYDTSCLTMWPPPSSLPCFTLLAWRWCHSLWLTPVLVYLLFFIFVVGSLYWLHPSCLVRTKKNQGTKHHTGYAKWKCSYNNYVILLTPIMDSGRKT